MQGIFVVFEGLDGSGKGAIIKEVEKFLLSKGFPEEKILLTAEPTRGLYGRKVRELLKSSVDPDVNAKQFLDLYVADRKEHIEKEILPALEDGKIILCDRYKYSTFVYQSLQGIAASVIEGLHKGMPVPDIVFVLDVPVNAALERINSDTKREHLESFEKTGFLEKVRKGFLNIRKIFPRENIIVVDASGALNEVACDVCKNLAIGLGK